jgi:prophage antirepressor-like protein
MINITPFNFNSQSVRVITDDNGDPWFVLSDVCKILDISNPTQVKSRLYADDVQVVDLQALHSNEGNTIKDLVNAVNESGLYSATLQGGGETPPPFNARRHARISHVPEEWRGGDSVPTPLWKSRYKDTAFNRTIWIKR